MSLSRSIVRFALVALIAASALALTLPLAYAGAPASNPTPLRFGGYSLQPPTSIIQRPTSNQPGKLDPALRKRLLTAAPGERIPIVIEMRDQADLGPALAQPDQAGAVVSVLQDTARRSQIGVRAFLAAKQIAGRADSVRSFWIFNGLSAHLAAEDVTALAARDDVALVREDQYRRWVSPEPTHQLTDPLAISSVEWGIHQIRADEVWAALNISGTGVVVANMDTGVDWQHPALQAAYRGYNKGLANHAGNWFDATDAGTAYPIDPHSHGTHTMGTLVGSGGIGVAPGAKWIAIRVLDSQGYGYDSWIHAGFEWALAPNGDASLAPDVLNNSWGSTLGSSTTFQNDLRALRAAGLFAVFSSGNSGPGAGTLGSPASLPEAFAVGATDDEDAVAWFSSRGPSYWGQIRPHVAAPGVNVRSSIPGGGYANYNGTSMAAPHVAGTAALMLSAHPSLTITDTAYVLTSTAVQLTAPIPNNDSGYGRIDAYAAVQSVASMGLLSGSVTRSDSGLPIDGALVSAVSGIGTAGSATTGSDGRYTRGLAASIYTVTASAFGYLTGTRDHVLIFTGTTATLNFALTPLPTGEVRGSLTDAESGQAISGTIVVIDSPVTVAATGTYSLALPGGSFEVRAIAPGHRILTATVAVTPGQIVTRDFALPPAPSILLVDSGPWYSGSQIDYYRAALDDTGYLYDEWRVKDTLVDVPTSATLGLYDVVVWSAPGDSPAFVGASEAVSDFLSAGGSLFISGQDVGYWDGGLSNTFWAPYYSQRLKAVAVQDDSGSRALTGTGVFSGVVVSIEGAGGADNQVYPDAIASADPDATAEAFRYDNGLTGAQTVGLCLPYRAVYLGFGFEGVTDAGARREIMSRAFSYFAGPRITAGMTLVADEDVVIAPPGSAATATLRLRNIGELGNNDTFTLTAQSPDWSASLPVTATLDGCSAQTLSLTVSIPPGTPFNVSRSITLAAQSSVSPALVVSDTVVVKSPGVVLLVDDDLFFDVEPAYQTALISSGVSFDRWDVPKNWAGPEPGAPPPDRLSWYPIVVWFTGYDWYKPLTASNEDTLTQYLKDGGRLLLSSQSHLGISGLDDFNQSRLGILDAAYVSTTLARAPRGSPFDDLGSLALNYPFPNWSESAAPYPSATVMWVGSHARPIALAHDDLPGRALFMSFPFEAISEAARPAVMERAVGYLSWLGQSDVSVSQSVAAPGTGVTVKVTLRNDGPAALSTAAFSATLPAGVLLQSGSLAWSGSLAPGQTITSSFSISLSGALAPGSLAAIPIAFTDDDHAITFHREARIGISRPDLSDSVMWVDSQPARSASVVTWTIVARNTGLADAPSAVITSPLPIQAELLSGTLTASAGAASEIVTGTVQWVGSIAAGESVTLTYRALAPATLTERLYYGSALFDDGLTLVQAKAWLTGQPHQAYLPIVRK